MDEVKPYARLKDIHGRKEVLKIFELRRDEVYASIPRGDTSELAATQYQRVQATLKELDAIIKSLN